MAMSIEIKKMEAHRPYLSFLKLGPEPDVKAWIGCVPSVTSPHLSSFHSCFKPLP